MGHSKKTLDGGILLIVVLFIVLSLPVEIWADSYGVGVVFDSVSNQPINGANVTLERYITELAEWQEANVETDIIGPANVTNPQASGWTGTPGKYQFTIGLGVYVTKTFRVKIGAQVMGYLFPSTFTPAEIQAQWPARRLGENTNPPEADDPQISWGQEFIVDADDVWVIDIPVDYCQPDVQIKNSSAASYEGGGVYNSDGTNQSAAQDAYLNDTVTYYIRIENDGTITATFTIAAVSDGFSGADKYYDALVNGNNITNEVLYLGGWAINNLVAGNTKEIRVEFTQPASVLSHKPATNLLINALVQLDPNIRDTVKAETTAYQLVQAGSSGDDDDDDGWDKCGLLGLEALLFICAVGFLKRRRLAKKRSL